MWQTFWGNVRTLMQGGECQFRTLLSLHRPHDAGPIQYARGDVGLLRRRAPLKLFLGNCLNSGWQRVARGGSGAACRAPQCKNLPTGIPNFGWRAAAAGLKPLATARPCGWISMTLMRLSAGVLVTQSSRGLEGN